ncbi:kinase-like domain-containing protein [Podospora australis]|uniref:non-specific serine/threonine protein kinase n=1 Tax=Podospora australis TaxID=1536484 RepID=A0AAN6WMQ1_9PEZI|nr:kinase-like domain-containing protein [Podospora australis]
MSLVPYHPREGREIVLRHHNAIVVRDPSSQRLEIRGLQLTECPTCHQSLRSSSPERHFEGPSSHHDSYVDPDYFRMLRAGQYHRSTPQPLRPPSSPIRRLVEPVPAAVSDEDSSELGIHDAEFLSSSPAPQQGGRIRREAFSPGYFNTFFIEERELGRGGKGVVLLVRHEIDGCSLGEFACKRVPVGDDHAWLEKVLVEVELLAKLSHPNLVSYRHVWLEDYQTTKFGPSVACAFILQQYCNGGDLLNYVVGDIPKLSTKEQLKAQMRRRSKGHTEPRPILQRRLAPEEIYSLFKDITSGLAYLHAANYIHRDLKPSNCLLHHEGSQLTCLISDFGEVQPENAVRNSTGSTGTISYCAPEVLRRDSSGRYGNFTTKSDIFSLGMILYFMCFGRLPYHFANALHEELEDIDQLRAEITDWKGFQDERRERPDLPSKLYQLLKKLLSVNPMERPTASEVLGAMKGESPLEGVNAPRGARNSEPSIGLGAHRIQNLDSPMPPSTPISEPAKKARVNSVADEGEDASSSIDGQSPPSSQLSLLQKRLNRTDQATPNLPRHRGSRHSMSLTRTASHSPDRLRRNSNLNTTALASPANITTPLLMAPPMTGMERIRNQAVLAQYKAVRWWGANTALLRLALLCVKILSMSWSCWPYSSSMGVMGLLLTVALVDLVDLGADNERIPGNGVGLGINNGTTNSNGAADGRDVFLRVGPNGSPRPTHAAGSNSVGVSSWSQWFVGWRRSWLLLVFHFAMLWASSRAAILCAAPGLLRDSDWTAW